MFAMVCTRVNIAYGASVLSRFLANPGKEHWQAVNSCFDKGILNQCLSFQKIEKEKANKSISLAVSQMQILPRIRTRRDQFQGMIFTLSEGAISWKSKCKLPQHYLPQRHLKP